MLLLSHLRSTESLVSYKNSDRRIERADIVCSFFVLKWLYKPEILQPDIFTLNLVSRGNLGILAITLKINESIQ